MVPNTWNCQAGAAAIRALKVSVIWGATPPEAPVVM
jgi:hypothetical protein